MSVPELENLKTRSENNSIQHVSATVHYQYNTHDNSPRMTIAFELKHNWTIISPIDG